MGVAVALTYKFMFTITTNNIVSLIVVFIIAGISYFGPMYICKKKHLI